MKKLTIGQIAAFCNGRLIGGAQHADRQIEEIITDSRKAREGCLFIPIKGARADGHDFIPGVIENGAACTLSERELDVKVPYVLVESTLQAIKDIARAYREMMDPVVVGITGSVGKTSTKEAIASVASQKYQTLKTLGNFNNELGLPFTIYRLEETDQVAVLEMGISEYGEMRRLSEIAQPDICVITNIGDCHLENLGSREGVLKAKSEIFDHMKQGGTVILNGDDAHLASVAEVYGSKPIFFGLDHNNDIYAVDVENLGLEGTRCVICSGVKRYPVHIPIPGAHMIYNALAAAAVGEALELDEEEIIRGIASLEAVGGRNNLIRTDKLTIIDDCYNANPASMRASLDVLDQAKGRKTAILGDMFELGEQEVAYHEELGIYASRKDLNMLICVGALGRHIAQAAIGNYTTGTDHGDNSCKVVYIQERKSLIRQLGDLVEEGDTVLVKASNGMKFKEVVEALRQL